MKISERSQKVSGIVEHKISELLRPFVEPQKMGFVTVTAVEVSGDLQVCDVFVRSFDGPQNFLKKLKKQEKTISHLLSRELDLRRNILVRFKEDKAIKTVNALDKFEKEILFK